MNELKSEILTFRMKQKQFFSLKELEEFKSFGLQLPLNEWEYDKELKNFILSPIATGSEQEIILYWEGSNQHIPGGENFQKYFKEKGYSIIKNPHVSILIEIIKMIIVKPCIKHYINIVLPVDKDFLITDIAGDKCFPGLDRCGMFNEICTIDPSEDWDETHAFIVCRE